MPSQLLRPSGKQGPVLVEVLLTDGSKAVLPATALVDAAGQLLRPQETLQLAANVGAAGNQPAVSAYGGNYLVRAFATSWAGASAKLQFLDADGTTWSDLTKEDNTALTPFSANATLAIGLGSNAGLRLVVTGAPAGLYVTASRMP